MEGFSCFPYTPSYPWAYSDQSLEADFSRLNVSSFRPPLFSGVGYPSRFNDPHQEGQFGHLGVDGYGVGAASDGLMNWSHEPLNNLRVADLRGKIASLAKDQYGCRFFERAMNEGDSDSIDMVFDEVVELAASLALDPYGNYVVQKLAEVCSEEQKRVILLRLTKNPFLFVTLCLNSRGTRCIQKLLKRINTRDEITLFVSALSSGVVDLSMNVNGQHIMEYCLKNFAEEHKRCLLNVVIENCIAIARDKVGCCVLQQCIDYFHGETKRLLTATIIRDAFTLAQHRYGNYVLQHLLGLRAPQVTRNILGQFEGSYMFLSCSKYGSNVVEKCLLESDENQSAEIIRELCSSPNLSVLLMHPFGNYVFQTAIAVSKGYTHLFLLNLVEQYTPALLNNQYGKRVLSWHERRRM